MLAAHNTVRRAIANRAVSKNLRFLVERFAELLDPDAQLSTTAAFRFDPLTALAEFQTLSISFMETDAANPNVSAMVDAVERTLVSLRRSAEVQQWYSQSYRDAVQFLGLLVDERARNSAGIKGRKAWLKRNLAAAQVNAAVRLKSEMELTPTFTSRLIEQVVASPDAQSRSDFQRLDDHAIQLALLLWSAGRSPRALVLDLASAVADARGHAMAVESARTVLRRQMSSHTVAFCLTGVTRLVNTDVYGCRLLRDNRWAADTEEDPLLGDLADERGILISFDVEAYDNGQAVELAVRSLEIMFDQFRAMHRKSRFLLPSKCCVRDGHGSTIVSVFPRHSSPGRPRPLLARPDRRLQRSLRYAALARAERSSVVQVLHCWIAVETMMRGANVPGKPYPMSKDRLPPLVSLHCVRQGLVAAWDRASRSGRESRDRDEWMAIEAWLGARRDRYLPDVNRWIDLLMADPVEGELRAESDAHLAAHALTRFLPRLSPAARHDIETWRFRLDRSPRLDQWCQAMEKNTMAVVGRMYAIRNSAVHTGLDHDDAVEPLARVSHLIIDLLFEVVPAWLEPGRGVWSAMDGVATRSSTLRRRWEGSPSPARFDGNLLTRPEGVV